MNVLDMKFFKSLVGASRIELGMKSGMEMKYCGSESIEIVSTCGENR